MIRASNSLDRSGASVFLSLNGASIPLPTATRDVAFNIEIEFDGSGYLLCYVSADGDLSGDTWHQTLDDGG